MDTSSGTNIVDETMRDEIEIDYSLPEETSTVTPVVTPVVSSTSVPISTLTLPTSVTPYVAPTPVTTTVVMTPSNVAPGNIVSPASKISSSLNPKVSSYEPKEKGRERPRSVSPPRGSTVSKPFILATGERARDTFGRYTKTEVPSVSTERETKASTVVESRFTPEKPPHLDVQDIPSTVVEEKETKPIVSSSLEKESSDSQTSSKGKGQENQPPSERRFPSSKSNDQEFPIRSEGGESNTKDVGQVPRSPASSISTGSKSSRSRKKKLKLAKAEESSLQRDFIQLGDSSTFESRRTGNVDLKRTSSDPIRTSTSTYPSTNDEGKGMGKSGGEGNGQTNYQQTRTSPKSTDREQSRSSNLGRGDGESFPKRGGIPQDSGIESSKRRTSSGQERTLGSREGSTKGTTGIYSATPGVARVISETFVPDFHFNSSENSSHSPDSSVNENDKFSSHDNCPSTCSCRVLIAKVEKKFDQLLRKNFTSIHNAISVQGTQISDLIQRIATLAVRVSQNDIDFETLNIDLKNERIKLDSLVTAHNELHSACNVATDGWIGKIEKGKFTIGAMPKSMFTQVTPEEKPKASSSKVPIIEEIKEEDNKPSYGHSSSVKAEFREENLPRTFRQNSIPVLRSKHDLSYDKRDDPNFDNQRFAHETPQTTRFTPQGDVFDNDNRNNTPIVIRQKPPEVKDLPKFSGRKDGKDDVGLRLHKWIMKMTLIFRTSSFEDKEFTKHFPIIFTDDAFDVYSGILRGNPDAYDWTIAQWSQEFLNKYISVAYMTSKISERGTYRFPRTEPDAYIFISKLYELSTMINPNLGVQEFITIISSQTLPAYSNPVTARVSKDKITIASDLIEVFVEEYDKLSSQTDAMAFELKRRSGPSSTNRRPVPVRTTNFRSNTTRTTHVSPVTTTPTSRPRVIPARRPLIDNAERYLADVTCYGCGKRGHYKRDCPDLKSKAEAIGRVVATILAHDDHIDESDAQSNDQPEDRNDAEKSDQDEDFEDDEDSYIIGCIATPTIIASVEHDSLRNQSDVAAYRDSKAVLPIPQHLYAEIASNSKTIIANQFGSLVPDGLMHTQATTWKIPFYLGTNKTKFAEIVIDTGAAPSLCKAESLAILDPDFESKIRKCSIKNLTGLNGKAKVLGTYQTSITLLHADGNLEFARFEFLVAENYSIPYDFIMGADALNLYHFQVTRPARSNGFIRFGTHPQQFFIPQTPNSIVAVISAIDEKDTSKESSQKSGRGTDDLIEAQKNHASHKNFIEAEKNFPSQLETVTIDQLKRILEEKDADVSEDFIKALEHAHINSDLTDKQKQDVIRIIKFNLEAFALKGKVYPLPQLGDELILKVTIPTPMPTRLKSKGYPLSAKGTKDMQLAIEDLETKGIIQRSNSPYAAASFMAYRNMADLIGRMVHDYRAMNEFLEVPAYPIPHIWATIEKIGLSTFFTTFDVVKAFFNMRLSKESRKYTAFIAHNGGHWEYNTGCFGLANMPADFQMRIEKLFSVQLLQGWLRIYIDDGLVNSLRWEDHLWQIHVCLQVVQLSGSRLALEKSYFGYPAVKYLGSRVSSLTIGLDSERMKAISELPEPKDRKSVQSILGIFGYNRMWIPNYSQIIGPLQQLVPLAAEWEWTEKHQHAFDEIKRLLCENVLLYHPNFDLPFRVYTDASLLGLGAGLYQIQMINDVKREVPIAFISRQLKKGEFRYGPTQLECLSVVWLLEKLHFYLHGATFVVYTDCAALRSLLTGKWVNRHMLRWQMQIQDYKGRMTISHRPGKSNVNADALSRLPLPNAIGNPAADLEEDDSDRIIVGHVDIGNISIDKGTTKNRPMFSIPSKNVEEEEHDESSSEDEDDELSRYGMLLLQFDSTQRTSNEELEKIDKSPYSVDDIKVASVVTTSISKTINNNVRKGYEQSKIYDSLYKALKSNDIQLLDKDFPEYLKSEVQKGKFKLFDDLIYRVNGIHFSLLVVDNSTQTKLLDSCHDEPMAGHFDADRTYQKLRQIAWWPKMKEVVVDYIKTCKPCSYAKQKTGKTFGLLQRIQAPTRPWQVINMDFVTALPVAGKENYNAVLVVVDRFSRRVVYIPCHKTTDAIATAKLVIKYVISQHGLPEKIISDRDSRFTSAFWKSMMQIMDVQLSMTTAYHPQADGLAERQIKTLEEGLRNFCAFGNKQLKGEINFEWIDALPMLEFAYNSSVHSSTGLTPFEVDIGRIPEASYSGVGLKLKMNPTNPYTADYLTTLKELQESAQEAVRRSFDQNKTRWDKSHQETRIKVGDYALLSTKNYRFSGTSEKLKSAFVGPFKVLDKIGENAFRLKLEPPFHLRHDVFSVSVLVKDLTREPDPRFADRRKTEIQRIETALQDDEHREWEIEFLLGERFVQEDNKEIRQYLIRWKGFTSDYDTWVDEKKITAPKLLQDFRLAKRNALEDQRNSPLQKSEKDLVEEQAPKKVVQSKPTKVIRDARNNLAPPQQRTSSRLKAVQPTVPKTLSGR